MTTPTPEAVATATQIYEDWENDVKVLGHEHAGRCGEDCLRQGIALALDAYAQERERVHMDLCREAEAKTTRERHQLEDQVTRQQQEIDRLRVRTEQGQP